MGFLHALGIGLIGAIIACSLPSKWEYTIGYITGCAAMYALWR